MRLAASHLMVLLAMPLVVGATCLPAGAEDVATVRWPAEGSRAEIRQPFHGSDIVVSTSSRTAGAIDSLTWAGTQFVNAYDHGRELQSAVSFDNYGECLNPTEAGSDRDRTGARSTSLLISLQLGPDWLQTRSQMAYFFGPGESHGNCPKGRAAYTSPRSDEVLTKRVTIGVAGVANAISYRATFSSPHRYTSAVFEAVTAYMPPEFSHFWSYDPATAQLARLSNDAGEQSKPVILANADGSRAMGVYSPDLPQPEWPNAGYGRFNFAELLGPGNATVKWNCVFRKGEVAPGDHSFTCYVLVGSLNDVQVGMTTLMAALTHQSKAPNAANSATNPRRSPPQAREEHITGVALYVGTQAGCNAGEVTIDPGYKRCATTPIGSTAPERTTPTDAAVFAGAIAGLNEGLVTNNPHHLHVETRPIGFLAPIQSGGTPLFAGTQANCNAGVASTNPAHLNCSSVPLGSTFQRENGRNGQSAPR